MRLHLLVMLFALPLACAAQQPLPILPSFTAAGVVHAADYRPQIAAGMIATVFGQALSNAAAASAASVPLPTSLSGTTIEFGAVRAPLFYVSAAQVNFQVPWELAGARSAIMRVITTAGVSPLVEIPLAAAATGIFTISQDGRGQGAILVNGVLAAARGTTPTSRPARIGNDALEIYCTGLGPVRSQPLTGSPGTSSPLTTVNVSGVVGGMPASVAYAGLAPGFVGLYQVVLIMPRGMPAGTATVAIIANGSASNQVSVAVE